MNKKIPLRSLAENISDRTGVDIDQSQAYIKALFGLISEQLLQAQSVSIRGLGEFSISHNPEEPIRFIVDSALSDELNAPFAMFNSVEIPAGIDKNTLSKLLNNDSEKVETDSTVTDGIIISNDIEYNYIGLGSSEQDEQIKDKKNEPKIILLKDLAVTNTEQEQSEEPVVEPDCNCSYDNLQPIEPVDTPIKESENIESKDDSKTTVEEIYIEPAIEVDSSIIPEDEEEFYYEVSKSKSSKFGLGFLLGLISGLIIGALCFVGYILYYVETGAKLF